MTANRPTTVELVEAVSEFLESKVMPAADPHTAFHTRVAVNTLGIIRRELELGPGLEAEEHQRLRQILGRDGGLDELNAELFRRIRDGSIDYQDQNLISHLYRTTMGRLSIDNPRYSSYKRALEAEGS